MDLRLLMCGSFSIQQRDDQFYQIFCATQESMDYVLSNGPLHSDNALVLAWPRCSSVQDLEKEYFCILLTGLYGRG